MILTEVYGNKARCLVDTGAQISCISDTYFNKLNLSKDSIKPSKVTAIVGVGGAEHKIIGLVELPLKLGQCTVLQAFHILPAMSIQLIIGIDFLQQHKATIDYSSNKLSILEGEIKVCFLTSHTGIVRIAKKVTIPARTEITIEAKVSRIKSNHGMLIEPIASVNQIGLLVAKSVVKVSDSKVFITIMNPQEIPVTMKTNKPIASISSVDINSIEPIDQIQNHKPTDNSINATSINNDEFEVNLPHPTDYNLAPDFKFDLSKSPINDTEKARLLKLLQKHKKAFATDLTNIGKAKGYEHKIDTYPDATPVTLPFYRTGPAEKAEIERQTNLLLEHDLIQPTASHWHSPVVLCKKKNGEWRFAIDYRQLNKRTIPQSFPLPRMSDVSDMIGQNKATIFSCLDLGNAYWQTPLDPETAYKSSFITHQGVFTWKRLPFGLQGSPASWQSLMADVFRNLNWKCLLVYVDDLIIMSKDFEEHLQHLDMVLERLTQSGLTAKPAKCQWALPSVKYLGNIFSKEGLEIDPDKVEAVRSYPKPTNQTEVRSFLGLTNFLKKFVKDYSRIVSPLNQLLNKETPFVWTDAHDQAFCSLRQKLIEAPILAYPNFEKTFHLTTDASGHAIGYVLSQLDDQGRDHPIAYSGRALRGNERHWTVTEQECLAVIEGIRDFKEYLSHQPFKIFTDHQALVWLLNTSHKTARLHRWSLEIQSFTFDITHTPGRHNLIADALSRRSYDVMALHSQKINSVPSPPSSTSTQNDSAERIEVTFEYDNSSKNPEILTVETDDSQSTAEVTHTSNIGTHQRKCPEMSPIIDFLENGILPDDSTQAKKISNVANQYEMLNGVLYHFYQPRRKRPPADERLIRQVALPTEFRSAVLRQFHDSIAGGAHLGLQRTFAAIRLRYYFPGMYQYIHDYIQSCEECQMSKYSRQQQDPPLTSLPVQDVFQRIHIDFIGPIHESSEGHKHILLVVDSYSKWPECFPLKTQEASEVARVLFREIFARYGAPKTLISDRGRNFMSQLVNALCEIFKVKHHYTSAYHPQTNATCERSNSTIEQAIRTYIDKDQSNWHDLLPGIMMALRMSPSTQSSQMSPFNILFGREMSLPFDASLIPQDNLRPKAKYHMQEVLENLKLTKQIATDNMQHAQQASKLRHDKKSKEPDFIVGDLVLLFTPRCPVGLSPKLYRKWQGPYYIAELGPNYTYRLRDCETNTLLKSLTNAKRLKRYFDPRERPTVISNDDEPETSHQDDSEVPIGVTPASDNNQSVDTNIPTRVTPAPNTKQSVSDNVSQGVQPIPPSTNDISKNASQTPAGTTLQNTPNEWHEAERLIKMSRGQGKKWYRVKWKNKSPSTWVCEDAVSEHLKREFHIKHTNTGRKRKRPYRFFKPADDGN
jgi:hypothetical protein